MSGAVASSGTPRNGGWQGCRRVRRDAWWFIVLGLLALVAVVILVWLKGGDAAAAAQWWRTMRGDRTMVKYLVFVRGGLTVAAWLALFVTGGLVATWRWWKTLPVPEPLPGLSQPDRKWRTLLLVILLPVLLAGMVRWPRMTLSLYNDEADATVRFTQGIYKGSAKDLASDNLPAFRTPPWSETAWEDHLANNHPLHNLLARWFNSRWQAAEGISMKGIVREIPLRFPALLGGLLSVAAAGALALRMGLRRSAFIVPFILAVHPWHVRFTTEARGYGLLMGFISLGLWFLAGALTEDRLPARSRRARWLGFGVCQALALWAYPGAVYLTGVMNFGIVIGFMVNGWRKKDASRNRETWIGWFIASLISGTLFLLTMAPILPQLKLAILYHPIMHAQMAPGWWPDVLGTSFFGMPWGEHYPENPLNPSLERWMGSPLMWGGGAATVILAMLGVGRLLKHGGQVGMLLVMVPAGSAILQYLLSAHAEMLVLVWYMVYLVPFAALWLGVGGACLLEWAGHGNGKFPRKLAAYLILSGWLFSIGKPLSIYRSLGKQALKESVLAARGGVFPFTEQQARPIVVGWWTNADVYDPTLKVTHDYDSLAVMQTRAVEENRPLYFILGMRPSAVGENPAFVGLLEDPEHFERVADFPGLNESQFHSEVFRWLGPSKIDRPDGTKEK